MCLVFRSGKDAALRRAWASSRDKMQLEWLEGTSMKLPTKPGPLRHARVRRAW